MTKIGYIQPGHASVLVDGQFGSTGKGLLAAYLASRPENEVYIATTNASANAGHWTKYADPLIDDFCCFHLPTFGVVQPDAAIYINAGAIINPDLLWQEMEQNYVHMDRVTIHPNAAVIEQSDIDAEMEDDSPMTRISSTRKGVGSALSRKILRYSGLAREHAGLRDMVGVLPLNQHLTNGCPISVEVPQGYSLSINGPFYPYTTSRNCTVGAAMADADIHPQFLGRVAMSMRTLPIRVGNIEGKGTSGAWYPDQKETNFDELGVEPELTTVTQRVRRIATWSDVQCRAAMTSNRPWLTFLNFCNYLAPNSWEHILHCIQMHSNEILGCDQKLLTGHGPNVEDVKPNDYSFNVGIPNV